MNYHHQLLEKVKNKSAHISVVGLGYAGLPVALNFARSGFLVTGVDIDQSKVDSLNKGSSFIEHIASSELQEALGNGFSARSNFLEIEAADFIIVCVPTPLNKNREPELKYINNTFASLIPFLRHGQLVSIESTTYPGMTEELIKPKIEEQGFKVGTDIFLAYSPERENPGGVFFEFEKIPKICSGISQSCLEASLAFYSAVVEHTVPVSSTRTAEMTKLLENIHRAVNVGLVNEMKMVSDKMGIDIHEVIDAAATKPFGFVPYYPGPGLGGHCIPIDPFYLTWKAKEYGVHTKFIELSGEVNAYMPKWTVNKINDALNTKGIALSSAKILILGVAYKKNVDDLRESPVLVIIDKLLARKSKVSFSDMHVKSIASHPELENINLSAESLKSFDCVVVATDHDKFDFPFIKKHAQLIIDSRGVYRECSENLIKA